MRIFFLVSLLFLVGCATVTVERQNNTKYKITNIMDYQTVSVETPEDFEKKIPQSNLILNSAVHFKKGFYTKKIAENVRDFDFQKGLIAILKNDKIQTNYENCYEILLNEAFEKVEISDLFISVRNENSFQIYDLQACGLIFSLNAKQKGIEAYGDKILVFENRYFEILNLDKSVYLSGNLFNRILKGHIYKDKVYLIDDKNNFVTVNLIDKTMDASKKFDLEYAVFENGNFYLQRDNSLLRINLDNLTVEDNLTDGSFISKSGSYIILTETLKNYFNSDFKNIEKIRYKDSVYFVLMGKELYGFDFAKEIFEKRIIFGKYQPNACSNGEFYRFIDVSGDEIYIDLKKISLTSKVEKFMCYTELQYKKGAFYYPDGKIAFRFADVVIEN
ncbi:hypothetical protein LF845_05875, partial [Deferribacterales bacterium Es71-Z0220]|uniref:hypothetical protein n=1 Tax=Deferrivibrio essentukiensis TaxID=2880922 RepID=UPI001F60CF91